MGVAYCAVAVVAVVQVPGIAPVPASMCFTDFSFTGARRDLIFMVELAVVYKFQYLHVWLLKGTGGRGRLVGGSGQDRTASQDKHFRRYRRQMVGGLGQSKLHIY